MVWFGLVWFGLVWFVSFRACVYTTPVHVARPHPPPLHSDHAPPQKSDIDVLVSVISMFFNRVINYFCDNLNITDVTRQIEKALLKPRPAEQGGWWV